MTSIDPRVTFSQSFERQAAAAECDQGRQQTRPAEVGRPSIWSGLRIVRPLPGWDCLLALVRTGSRPLASGPISAEYSSDANALNPRGEPFLYS